MLLTAEINFTLKYFFNFCLKRKYIYFLDLSHALL